VETSAGDPDADQPRAWINAAWSDTP